MRARTGLWVSLFYAAGCAGADPAPRPAPVPPPRPPEMARWMPIEVAPSAGESRLTLASGEAELRVDRGGVRWLFAKGKEPAHAAAAEPSLPLSMGFVMGGLFAIGADRRARFAREPLGAWEDLGPVPEGARADTIAVWRGGVTAEIDGVVSVVPALTTVARGEAVPAGGVFAERAALPWMEGRRPVEARIGADGQGIALFSPQALGVTTDGGRTFTRLDDRWLHVSELADDGERVVLKPGGVRDVFARAFTPGSTALARTPAPALGEGMVSPRALDVSPSVDDPAPRKTSQEGKARVRGGLHHALAGRSAVVDGDTWISLVYGGDLGIGALGEGVAWSRVPAFEKMCRAGRLDSLSASGGTITFRCGNEIFALRPNQVIRVPLTAGVGAAMLESSSRAVVLRVETNLADRSVTTVAYRVDLENPKREEVIARGAGLWAPDQIHRRAGDAAAPFWATRSSDARHLYRIDAGALTRVDLPAEAPGDLTVAGFSADGGVVLRSRSTLARLVYVSPAGEVEIRPTPLPESATDNAHHHRTSPGKATWGSWSLNHDGRGLAVDEGDHAWQTTDAGRTWQKTAAPGRRALRAHVVCGRSRCELEDVAVRVGWDEAEPKEAGEAEAPREAAKEARGKGIALSCAADDARRPRLVPAQHGYVVGMVPGTGDHLWSGIGILDRTKLPADPGEDQKLAREGVEQEMLVLHGDADGRVEARSAARWRIDWRLNGGNGRRNARIHAGRVLGVAWTDPTRAIGSFSAILPVGLLVDTGKGAPQRLRGDFGLAQYPTGDGLETYFGLGVGSLAAAEGLSLLDDHARKLHWVSPAGALETRSFPGLTGERHRMTHYEGTRTEGGFARTADGRWLTAQLVEERALRLVEIAQDGVTRDASMLVDLGDRERGVGLLAEGDALFAALVEPVEGGGAELRLRPIDGDLRLGAAVTLGRGAKGEPLALPACGAGMPAAEVRLTWPGGARLQLGALERKGALVREVRFDRARACVRSTWIEEELYVSALLRGLGDGPGVVRDVEGNVLGATCRVER